MILLNGIKVKQDRFGDGTLKCSIDDIYISGEHPATITWAYDDDSELFTVACINDYLKYQKYKKDIILKLPYIPNARQDRYVSNRLFTLRTFCNLINNMEFSKVEVLDPHSNVATALLLNVYELYPSLTKILEDEIGDNKDNWAIMYPDAGAAKKYQEYNDDIKDFPIIIGNKHRNTEGRIESYELLNFPEGVKNVVIQDDIVSYGGTFISAAKALKEKGVEHIYILVSHCESNIFKGDLLSLDCIDKVITTDSILDFTKDYEGFTEEKKSKLKILDLYRKLM